jgi:DNA invertase Pin-like site-specific DNA recombinase
MVMMIGYARTSTFDQTAGLEAQHRELTEAGCSKIFSEQVSSVAQRPQLEAALAFIREGDRLVVTKLDRLARSVADLVKITARLEAKSVTLVIRSLNIDTATPTGKLMLNLIGSIAQFEREIMLERQREGIASAKAVGKYKGRQPTARKQSAEVLELKAAGRKPMEIAAKLGISRASVFRIMKSAESKPQDFSGA